MLKRVAGAITDGMGGLNVANIKGVFDIYEIPQDARVWLYEGIVKYYQEMSVKDD